MKVDPFRHDGPSGYADDIRGAAANAQISRAIKKKLDVSRLQDTSEKEPLLQTSEDITQISHSLRKSELFQDEAARRTPHNFTAAHVTNAYSTVRNQFQFDQQLAAQPENVSLEG